MKKTLIALAALGAATGSAFAQSSFTIYGIVDLGLVKQNRADAPSNIVAGATAVATGTHNVATLQAALGGVGLTNKELNVAQATKSRLGFKGVEDLGGGYKAMFSLEHRFVPDTGSIDPAGPSFWDQSIVSLLTPVGLFSLGRDYIPAFYLQYLLDPWLNQGIAELGGTSYAFAGYSTRMLAGSPFAPLIRGARVNNAAFYTIKVDGLVGQAYVSMKEDGAYASGNAGKENRMGFGVSYSAGPLYVGLAYDKANELGIAATDNNLLMLGGAYDFGIVKPRLSYARYDAGTTTPTSFTLAATFPINTHLIKAGVTQLQYDDAASTKSTKYSLGYEHVLSKRTAVYTDITSGKTTGLQTVTGLDVGIRHSF